MTDVRYEVFLARIEVMRGKRNIEEDDNVWRVTLDHYKPTQAKAAELLRPAAEGGVGRVLLVGIPLGVGDRLNVRRRYPRSMPVPFVVFPAAQNVTARPTQVLGVNGKSNRQAQVSLSRLQR